MQLHCLTLDQFGLECLNTQTVQRRSTVHQHGVSLDDILQNAPDNGVFAVDDLLGRLHRLDDAALDKLADDERLVEFGSHIFRDTHFVHLQLGADDDDRTGRIVDALTEQVLTETALLTLQRIRKRLERTVRFVLDSIALARVVEQRIDSLLQHTFLVAQNDLRSLDFDQSFQTVVTDDDTTIEVVQIRRSETTAVERHQRTQLGRNHRNDTQHHPLRTVFAIRSAERFDDVQALQSLGLALHRRLRRSFVTQRIRHRIEIYIFQQV